MNNRISAALAVALAVSYVAPLQAQKSDRAVSSSDTRFETLRPESSFPDWRRLAIERAEAERNGQAGPAGMAYVQTLPGDPLSQNGPETTGAYWLPLSHSLSSLIETSVVPGNLGGVERSVLGLVGAQFGSGWGMQAGIRHSDLSSAQPDSGIGAGLGLTALPAQNNGLNLGADLGQLTFERFWDRYRGAYTVSSGRADGGAIATSHRVQLNYFYAARSSVGLSYTIGRSFETSIPLNALTPVETTNLGVIGEHWFTPSWAVNYNALIEDRGIEGLKPEIRLGLRLRF